ncbi:MAG: InlB B-repeat-containing protein, partial [Methanomassiliicoccaceae archaeon]|nr:InlB B-repeat-containing protein [Methanomassiliicoccaceae archaeon]
MRKGSLKILLIASVLLIAPLTVPMFGEFDAEQIEYEGKENGTEGLGAYGSPIPITNARQLQDMSANSITNWPGLDCYYYLTNDIIFTDADNLNGGILIPLKVEFKTARLLEVTIGGTGGTLWESIVSFGSCTASDLTAGVAELMPLPSTWHFSANTLVIGGKYTPPGASSSSDFAFSLIIDQLRTGVQFDESFDSNGNFTPIGQRYQPFTGTFDGRGYTISGMNTASYGSGSSELYSGLFGHVGKGGTVMNVNIEDSSSVTVSSNASGNAYAGGVVGYISLSTGGFSPPGSSSITNCIYEGAVSAYSLSGNAYAGGIVGNTSPVERLITINCRNLGTVIACSPSGGAYAGGITGYVYSSYPFYSSITNCYNYGNVLAYTSYGGASAGGIAGYAYGAASPSGDVIIQLISNCHNSGSVTARAFLTLEDIFGRRVAKISAGGIVGDATLLRRSILNCYNQGSVVASSLTSSPEFEPDLRYLYYETYAGGIVGNVGEGRSYIVTCGHDGNTVAQTRLLLYSQESVLLAAAYAGGIVGMNRYVADSLHIDNCRSSDATSPDIGFGNAIVEHISDWGNVGVTGTVYVTYVRFDPFSDESYIYDTMVTSIGSFIWRPQTGNLYFVDGLYYACEGWYSDEKFTIPFDFNKPIADSTTIYEGWELWVRSVTFDSKEGSAAYSVTVPYGKTVTRPPDPVKDNNTFAGWYSDVGLTTLFNFSTSIYNDRTLYAGWGHMVTVNGGTGGGGYMEGRTVSIVADELEGKVFAAWTTESEISFDNFESAETSFVMIGESVTVTAVYTDAPVHSILLSQNEDKDFGSVIFGYTTQTPYNITVNNSGNQPTGALIIALSGTDAERFTLSTGSIGSIAVGGNGSFTIVPNGELSVGEYHVTVTVSNDDILPVSFNARFEVTSIPILPLITSNDNTTLRAGYGSSFTVKAAG